MSGQLPAIDWARPWLQPWRAWGEPLALSIEQGLPLHQGLNLAPEAAHGGHPPLRFVPQGELPPGEAYEAYIFRSRQCPVREGLHDFFNGLCWLHFPHTKQRLNQLQAEQIAAAGVSGQRGPVRDALTLFDENAAILQAPPALWQALEARDWQRLFVTLRPLWAQAQLLLFGHALLEKLVSPRKAIVAHVYRAQAPGLAAAPGLAQDGLLSPAALAGLDARLAGDLKASWLATKPFVPLPVLGVPGWWPGNEQPGFYADAAVFRPPKT